MSEKQKQIDELELRISELREEYEECLERDLERVRKLNDEWMREKAECEEWPVWKVALIGMILPMAISTLAIVGAITKF